MNALGVFGSALGVGGDTLRRVAIFERGDGAGDVAQIANLRYGFPRRFHRSLRQLACVVTFARERAAVGAKGVGRDDAGSGVEVVEMNLAQRVEARVGEQGVGRPQRQAGIHAAPIEFGAGRTVEDERVGLGKAREERTQVAGVRSQNSGVRSCATRCAWLLATDF